jgi:hypothetical protein
VRVYQFRHTGMERQSPNQEQLSLCRFQWSMIFSENRLTTFPDHALVEHDLFGKPANHFSGSCSSGASFGNWLRFALQPGIYIAGYRRRQKKIKLSWPRLTKRVSGLASAAGIGKVRRPRRLR